MSTKPVWREYGEAIFIAFLLAMFIRFFAMQAYQIPSGSMLDTLLIGDRLLVNRLSYNVKVPFTDKVIFTLGQPEVGDVVVFTFPDPNPSAPRVDYIKRVIGTPGDVIEMRESIVYRNGQKLDEPYTRYLSSKPGGFFSHSVNSMLYVKGSTHTFEPITVPEGHYFVMGDNRDDSKDSRYWGFVNAAAMHGKAWRIYWSWGNGNGSAGSSGFADSGPRWGRIGRLIQ